LTMNKKILVAIDGSRNSLAALDYVHSLGRQCPNLQLVLFHVLPPVPPVYKEAIFKDPIAQKYLLQWREKHRETIERVLKKSKDKLLHWGWEEAQVRIKAQEKRVGLARDILFEAQKGLYDALVVGRRGLSKVEEFFLGSVSGKVLQGAGDIPVWLIGGKVEAHKILIALDGSENALRAVDHVSFIVESCRSDQIEVLLLNTWPGLVTLSGPRVIPNFSSLNASAQEKHKKKMESFLDQAENLLLEAGLPAQRIKKKICWRCADISKSILSEAEKGDCGTIVLGRRGISKAQEFFMGSVSTKVIQLAGQKAVWIVG
jgi:nucleotide-binding universal stress UspA family protein